MSKRLLTVLLSSILAISTISCSKKNEAPKNQINIDLGEDIATLDPQMAEDVQSTRVSYDLFEGLTSVDQHNKPIAGLADKWEISPDGKKYTFHLRPNIKFSNGSPITTDDIIFSYHRLADPKTASPYNFLVSNIQNGQNIIDGKAKPDTLGIKAIDSNTIEITLNYPDATFLAISSMPNLGIVSKDVVTKFGRQWTDPKNIATSGAYKLDEYVVRGHILLSKNTNYYDTKDVAIEKVKFLPIVDQNSALSQYKSGNIDMTYRLPADQYKAVKNEFGDQEHTILWEAIEYYDFNMKSPKFKDINLRKALSMAVDREAITENVLGHGEKPLYSYVTSTIEGGKYDGINYDWASWPRDKQIATAKELFAKAGYGPKHPLVFSLSYNTNDAHKKKAIALTSMWQHVFGADSIKTTQINQEFKTFLQTRHKGDYDIARDGWVADYDSVNSYTALYTCHGPQNNAHSCTPNYNNLMNEARATADDNQKVELTRQAIKLAMENYSTIPLLQNTYYRLVSPRVQNYDIDNNHLDHVMTKWFKLK